MALAEVQRVLARLYTDAGFRAAFFADPAAEGACCGLTPAEAEQTAALEAAEVDRFARSLVSKRLNEVAKLLPLTRDALRARFLELFRGFAETYTPVGPHRHLDDALRFADWLAALGDVEPLWVPDLARYEAAHRLAVATPVRWLVRRFRYPVHQLGEKPTTIGARATIALWFRPLPRSPLRNCVICVPRARP